MPANQATITSTLHALTSSGVAKRAESANIASTLPKLTSTGELTRPGRSIQVISSLPSLQSSAVAKHAIRVDIASVLPRLTSTGKVQSRGVVYSLTGQVRASGSAIFVFVGPPNRALDWSITQGGGALFPDVDYTDSYGRASCRYSAGGYEGPLTIGVSYGG